MPFELKVSPNLEGNTLRFYELSTHYARILFDPCQMLIKKDPKGAIYFHDNLVWYQCKLLRDLGLVIALCSMENCHILQDF